MQEAKHPTSTKLPPQSQSSSPSPSAPAVNHLPYHHDYGTFPQPFQPTPPVVGAAYHDYHASPNPIGFGGQGVVAFPCAVQQQVFVEGVPVREPPLPFCGVGVGWFLFLLGFFLAAIPWYAGAFLLFFVALDHREKPGLIACTVAGIFALVPFILNGIRLNPFWFMPCDLCNHELYSLPVPQQFTRGVDVLSKLELGLGIHMTAFSNLVHRFVQEDRRIHNFINRITWKHISKRKI